LLLEPEGQALIIDILGYRSQGEEKAETLKFVRLKAVERVEGPALRVEW
jgi:hypothetical protein